VQCTKFLQTPGLIDRQCPSKVSMKKERLEGWEVEPAFIATCGAWGD
jgi:hypothetical protein